MLKQSLIALSLFSLTACLGGGGGGSKNLGPLMDSKFVDAPVQGLQYYQDGEQTRYKLTGPNGEFECNVGSKVTFSLRSGYTDIGSVICGSSVVFPMDLDVSRSPASEKADIPKFVALLLHFMDEDFKGTNFADITNKGRIEIDTNFISAADIDVDMDDNTLTVERILGVIATIKVLRTRKCDDLMDEDWTDCYISEVGEAYSIDSNGDYSANLVNALAEIDLHLAQSCATYGDGTASCRNYTEDENDEEGDENGDGKTGFTVSMDELRTLIQTLGSTVVSEDGLTHLALDGSPIPAKCLDFTGSSSINTYLGRPVHVSSDNDTITLCVATSNFTTDWYYTGIGGYDPSLEAREFTANAGDIFPKTAVANVRFNENVSTVDGYVQSLILTSTVLNYNSASSSNPDRIIPSIKGKFLKVGGDIRWFRSCDDEAIAGLTLANVCSTPENFNPIN